MFIQENEKYLTVSYFVLCRFSGWMDIYWAFTKVNCKIRVNFNPIIRIK